MKSGISSNIILFQNNQKEVIKIDTDQLAEVSRILIGKLREKYLDLNWFVRKGKKIGDDGLARAREVVIALTKFEKDEAKALNYALELIPWNDGKGVLGNSKNLRLLIAQTLADHLWINKTAIQHEAFKNAPIMPGVIDHDYKYDESIAIYRLIHEYKKAPRSVQQEDNGVEMRANPIHRISKSS